MDMMLLGELVANSAASQNYYGFRMPAGGNDGVAAIEVFEQSGSDSYKVYLQTKSSDAADSAATAIGNATIASTGVTKFDVSNAQDLVRYRVESLGDGVFMHFQFAQPLWSPN